MLPDLLDDLACGDLDLLVFLPLLGSPSSSLPGEAACDEFDLLTCLPGDRRPVSEPPLPVDPAPDEFDLLTLLSGPLSSLSPLLGNSDFDRLTLLTLLPSALV